MKVSNNEKKENWHPLLESERCSDKVDVDGFNTYSMREILISVAAIVLMISSVFCCKSLYNLDDPNPMAGIGILILSMIYIIGFLASGFLLWYCIEEQLKFPE